MIDVPQKNRLIFYSYYAISRHYKWMLSQVFDVLQFDVAIIVEGVSRVPQSPLNFCLTFLKAWLIHFSFIFYLLVNFFMKFLLLLLSYS